MAAVEGLGKLATRPEASVQALAGALSDSHNHVRATAALALRHFGANAASALPTLEAAKQEPDEKVRQNASISSQRIAEALKGSPARE